MARLIQSADELYYKHKKLIYKLIHRYAKDGCADFEDLESLSNEVFTRCFRKWEPSKGAFITLLYTALSNAFRAELKIGENRARHHNDIGLFLNETKSTDSLKWLVGFLETIDHNARQVIGKLLFDETKTRKTPLSKAQTKGALMTVMVNKDWTKAKVKQAFKDIKEALKV